MFIKVGDEALAPIEVALGRMLFGTAALLLIMAVTRESLPRGWRLWGHLAIAAILFNSLPFILFAYGETRTTSVLAGIWNGTTPLFTLLVSMAALAEERPTRQRSFGLLIGFGGVLVVLGVWQGFGGHQMAGNLACMAAAICYGIGFPYTRRFLSGRPESIVSLATGQLICGTVELAVITPFFASAPASVPLKVVAAIFALGAFGTGIGYVLNYGIIKDAGPTLASTVTYIVPIFATIEGMLFLGEPLTWFEPVGAAIVILGVAVSQGMARFPARSRTVAVGEDARVHECSPEAL